MLFFGKAQTMKCIPNILIHLFPGAETSKMKESVMNSIKTDKENINKQMKDIEKTVQV